MVRLPLNEQTTTDTRGQGREEANGTSAKASRSTASAAFGLPNFGHDQRTVAREVLQSDEIGFKARPRLEEHVEAHQIKKRQIQILRRGVVSVREQAFRIFALGDREQIFNKPLDPALSVPPHNVCGNLIGEGVAQHSRMTGALASTSLNPLLDILDSVRILEKGKISLSLQPHDDVQSMLLCNIQQPSRRCIVRPDGVHAVRGHQGKVPLHNFESRVCGAKAIGVKGSVGYAAHEKFLAVNP